MAALRFYSARLGMKQWRAKRRYCLTSGRKAVVALVSRTRRRLGVVIDSRGADSCQDHAADIAILLELNYPS
jgi:hypothetical protein